MKILILTCNTGGGHNSAALALKSYFDKHNVTCDIADFLGFGKEIANNIICNGHVFIYRHAPKLFEIGYKISENETTKRKETIIYKYCSKYAKKLYEFLQQNKYDCIISVHVFASLALDYIKKNLDPLIYACHVSTDYTCYPEIANTDLDKYFIAHKKLENAHAECGIDTKKLVSCGIPVRDVFFEEKISKEDARKALNITNDKKLIIIAGGSMGCGPIEDIAVSLISNYQNECNVAVICGSNEKLYDTLKKYPKLILYGFVSDIEVHMQAADILITKAGGLTITEAAALSLPIVFVNAVSGCEGYNREFFAQNTYALSSYDVDKVVENVGLLLSDEFLYNKIKTNLDKDFRIPAQQIIFDELLEVSTVV